MDSRQPELPPPVERSRLGFLALILLLGLAVGGGHAECSFMSGDERQDNENKDKGKGNKGGVGGGAGGMG